MVDLPDVLASRLREAGYDAQVKRLDDADNGGLVIRRLPAVVSARYLDGTLDVRYMVQIIAVCESEAESQEIIDRLAYLVPNLDLASENGSYRFTSIDIYSAPTETRPPERGYYAWDVVFEAVITTTKGRLNA